MNFLSIKDPSRTELRVFGLILCLLLSFIEYKWGEYGISTLTWLGLSLFFFGMAFPTLLKWPYFVWVTLAQILGFINMNLLLIFCYFFMFTPIAIFFRLRKRDRLQLNKKTCDSYFEDYDKQPYSLERYRHLF